jgi:hypothetical protein
VTGRGRRRRKQLLDDLKETRGYCKLKEEALDLKKPLWMWLWNCCKTDNRINWLINYGVMRCDVILLDKLVTVSHEPPMKMQAVFFYDMVVCIYEV